MQNVGSSIAIWNISLRLRSPPLNPSFTERFTNLLSIDTSLRFSRIIDRKSEAFIGSSPWYLRLALTAAFRKFAIDTPGISIGCWKDMKMPAFARSSGFIASRSCPSNMMLPSVTSYEGSPTITLLSVDLPAPLVPISA